MDAVSLGPGVFVRYPAQAFAVDADLNPYDPPQPCSDARSITRRVFAPKRGPAIVIVSGALLGAIAGLLFLMSGEPIGLFGVLPGAVVGGLAYRIASRSLDIDPTARMRRYKYAAVSIVTLPTMAALATGMQGQGRQMTIGALLIGGAVALGILVSGDRRAKVRGSHGVLVTNRNHVDV